jgi:hypothetical protein
LPPPPSLSGIEAFADKILSWSSASTAPPCKQWQSVTFLPCRFPHYYTLKTMALLWLQVQRLAGCCCGCDDDAHGVCCGWSWKLLLLLLLLLLLCGDTCV